MIAKDCFGNEVKKGDIIVYGSSQGHSKAGLRIGIVLDPEKPKVQPFERKFWGGNEPAEWEPLRVFSFSDVKRGDFAIIQELNIVDPDLKEIMRKVDAGELDDLIYTTCAICKKRMVKKNAWVKDDDGNHVHYKCKYTE